MTIRLIYQPCLSSQEFEGYQAGCLCHLVVGIREVRSEVTSSSLFHSVQASEDEAICCDFILTYFKLSSSLPQRRRDVS